MAPHVRQLPRIEGYAEEPSTAARRVALDAGRNAGREAVGTAGVAAGAGRDAPDARRVPGRRGRDASDTRRTTRGRDASDTRRTTRGRNASETHRTTDRGSRTGQQPGRAAEQAGRVATGEPATPRTYGYGRPPPPTRLQRFSRATSYAAVLSWVVVVIAVVVDAAVGPGPKPWTAPVPEGAPDALGRGVPVPPAGPMTAARAAREPVRLEIPAMGVDTVLGRAVRPGEALRAAGGAAGGAAGRGAPARTKAPIMGWHRLTPAAGMRGNALVIGHVDTSRRSAVAGRFGLLRAGDTARIVRGDGTTAEFRIDSVERVRPGRFPVGRVYGPAGRSGIRIVSLGARTDRRGDRHPDAVIAYGHASRR